MHDHEREALFCRLAEMPGYLTEVARRLGAADARRRSHGGGFALVEHVWHLADIENDAYAVRIRRIRQENRPELADFDGAAVARERQYQQREIAAGLQAFALARRHTLDTLRQVSAAEWSRPAQQQSRGALTLEDLPRIMAEHDLSHRDEIGELEARGLCEQLHETPQRLRSLVAEFGAEALRRLPAHDFSGVETFSVAGHVCHLRDIEIEGYDVRIRRLRSETEPLLPSIAGEQVAVARNYQATDVAAALEAFERARHNTLETLAGVRVNEWSRAGDFEGYGRVSLLRLVQIITEHDAGHLAAIAQLPRR